MRELLVLCVAGAVLVCSQSPAVAGKVSGQFVLVGDAPEVPPLLVPVPGGGAPVCASAHVADQSLVVDSVSKGIANIVLFPTRRPKNIDVRAAAVPIEPVVFDQKRCQFEPHVLLVRAGQDVIVKSNDPCAHNVRSSFIKNKPFNFTVAPNDRVGQTVSSIVAAEPLPMPIKCDLHPYMIGYWVITDHPYAAVTDKDGKFVINGLPPGDHKFRVWHERVGYIERSLKVNVPAEGNVALPVVNVPLKDFKVK